MTKTFRKMLEVLLLVLPTAICSVASADVQQFGPDQPVAYYSTCSSLTTDLTTYSHTGIAISGLDDRTPVVVAVGVLGEDAATVFDIVTVTVDGNATNQASDDNGTVAVNAGFFYTTAKITGAASVDVSVTYSEAVTGSVVCVFAVQGMQANAEIPFGSLSTTTGNSSLMNSSLGSSGPTKAFVVSNNAAIGVNNTFGSNLTEIQDACNAEFCYAQAAEEDIFGSDGINGYSSDWSGTAAASQATIVFSDPNNSNLIPFRATCVADNTDQTTYTFTDVSTGMNDGLPGMVVVGVAAEDAAATYSISSATANGETLFNQAFSNTGTGYAAMLITLGEVRNWSLVDVSITFSEAITGAVVCVWGVTDAQSPAWVWAQAAGDAAAAAMNFFVAGAQTGAYWFGICTGVSGATTFTWTSGALAETEHEDVNGAEIQYSTASAPGSGIGTRNNTCDAAGASATNVATLMIRK
jgi:hypothetical protein